MEVSFYWWLVIAVTQSWWPNGLPLAWEVTDMESCSQALQKQWYWLFTFTNSMHVFFLMNWCMSWGKPLMSQSLKMTVIIAWWLTRNTLRKIASYTLMVVLKLSFCRILMSPNLDNNGNLSPLKGNLNANGKLFLLGGGGQRGEMGVICNSVNNKKQEKKRKLSLIYRFSSMPFS